MAYMINWPIAIVYLLHANNNNELFDLKIIRGDCWLCGILMVPAYCLHFDIISNDIISHNNFNFRMIQILIVWYLSLRRLRNRNKHLLFALAKDKEMAHTKWSQITPDSHDRNTSSLLNTKKTKQRKIYVAINKENDLIVLSAHGLLATPSEIRKRNDERWMTRFAWTAFALYLRIKHHITIQIHNIWDVL